MLIFSPLINGKGKLSLEETLFVVVNAWAKETIGVATGVAGGATLVALCKAAGGAISSCQSNMAAGMES